MSVFWKRQQDKIGNKSKRKAAEKDKSFCEYHTSEDVKEF